MLKLSGIFIVVATSTREKNYVKKEKGERERKKKEKKIYTRSILKNTSTKSCVLTLKHRKVVDVTAAPLTLDT